MRPALALLPLLAGCATLEDDSLVDNLRYRAAGPPGWRVEIGDDIGLRLGHAFYDFPIAYTVWRFPWHPAREWDGVRRWRSVTAGYVITIEARPGPCTNPGGEVYADDVRVRRNWGEPDVRDLRGCGGRLISAPARN